MWTTIINIMIKVLIALISDRKLVTVAKSLLNKAVVSAEDKVGIDNKDAREIIESITKSSLNNIDETVTKHFIG